MDGKPPPPKRSQMPPLPDVSQFKTDAVKPKASIRQIFQCPNCGASVKVTAVGSTVSVACGSCASVIDAKDPNHQILSKAAKNLRIPPVIPLGTRGKLHGTLWEVIGFMQRSDGSGIYHWREYLLFNPAQGFRWLVESQGHWNYVVPLHERPKKGFGNTATVLGKSYRHFLSGEAVVQYVVGEFYWRVKVGDKVQVADFISPPEILSTERDKGEENFSLGEYVEPSVIQKAFAVDRGMPVPDGVSPNQPSAYQGSLSLSKQWGTLGAVLFLVQLIGLISSSNKLLDLSRFEWSKTTSTQTFSTPPFELKKISSLEVELTSPVSNNWFEISGDLVNEETGETEEFELGVEYYSGHDSDGSWSEGSQRNSRVLSSIQPGRYHLNIQGSSDTGTLPFEVKVKEGVPLWSNFLLTLTLLSAFPAFILWRSHRFETARWSGSDYAGDEE